MSISVIFLIFIICYYLSRNNIYQKIYYAIRTLPRDLHLTYSSIKLSLSIQYWEYKKKSIGHLFLEHVRKFPNKIAIRCEENILTFQQVEEITNQMARYFKEECNLSRGDTVALMLPNSEYFACYWFALSKIGVKSALINSSQVGKVLQHSLIVSKADSLVYDTTYTPVLLELGEYLNHFQLIHVGADKNLKEGDHLKGSKDIQENLSKYSKQILTDELDQCRLQDELLYIYTSGTTGLPKAAVITQARFILMSYACTLLSGMTENDIIYTCLPLFHSAGGIISIGQTFLNGSTSVVRKKFSASNFWSDCIKYNCTAAQYIGEICRYLLLTPETSNDRAHKVKIVFGNGLRPQIWEKFIKRFNIKQVAEYYGSTEGNTNLVNAWNEPGAVGYLPWFVKRMELIQINSKTLEPIRHPVTGLCIKCDINEEGLLVGKLIKSPISTFKGYVDPEATKKKMIYNVLEKGDCYVNSGDLLLKNELNCFYFKDRTGDTFRWKSENVSTCEVEAVISNIIGLKDAIAYGVQIPGTEGRAGMVAIVDEHGQLDINKLEQGVTKELSKYARPIFVRIIKSMPMTETYKIKKMKLQEEGYNPNEISDPLYYLKDCKNYIKLDKATYKQIINNQLRL